MDQEKIGKFIAELRKEKGLTQKNLAEKLHVTDKAISKWECGHSLPDNFVMMSLCEVLGVTANEILSAQKLSSTDYNKKAEENIMSLIKENHDKEKKTRRHMIISSVIVILLFLYFIWFVNRSTKNELQITYFFDLVALNVVIVLPLIMLILAKQFSAFINLFKFNFRKCDDPRKIVEAKNATSFAIKAVLCSGGICSIIYFVNWMRCLSDLADWGPNLALIILGIFYSLVISAILLILKERIR